MSRYVLRRLLWSVVVVFVASVVVFLLLRAIPGDPAAIAAGEFASAQRVAEVRHQFGLDRPLYEQYFSWVTSMATGDLGRSWRTNELVWREITNRLPATLELGLLALVIGVVLGIIAGVIAALYRGTLIDHFVTLVSLVGTAVPVFWIGIVSIMLFAATLHVLPLGSRADATYQYTGPTGLLTVDAVLHLDVDALRDALAHLIMPAITLAWFPLASVARVTRSSLLEVLGQEYVRTARAKGLRERVVIGRHAVRNALVPVITIVGLSFGPVVGGAVLTETVFSWPGIGRYIVDEVRARDFPSVQAIVLLSAIAFTFINLAVDVAYAYVDPRIRYAS